VEVTSGGGKGVWSDSPPAYPVLPGVTLAASSLLSSSPHIPATTQLLTVTGLPRQWGAVHPAARDPPVTLGRIPQWTHIWTLGVTMLAKRNGHDPPPQHSRSRPPESPLGVARVGGGVLIRGPNSAPVVIRAIGGLLTILPRAVNRAVRLICACHLCSAACHLLFCGLSPFSAALLILPRR
jgi:hypothetical protein